MSFELCREEIPFEDLPLLFSDIPFIRTQKKVEYANVPASFDIETTSFIDECDDKVAVMYGFVFGVNGKAVIGRSWEDVGKCFQMAKEALNLGEDRRLVVYVHNLAYEFQFIRDRFAWKKIFATEERKPIYAVTMDGIEFRCSLRLSGYSLEKVGEHLHTYKVDKKVGDLDYLLLRHPDTPLTEKERGYILNDGLVVMAYIQEEIEANGNISKIPLTKTGYVRRYVRNACLYGEGGHKKNGKKFYRYHKLMEALTLDLPEYEELVRAFQGGFTHASNLWSRRIAHDVASFDFSSSYPAVMVSEKFPMGKAERIKISSKAHFDRQLSLYCCLFDVCFEGIESTFPFDHYLSSSKCRRLEGEELDNGRVVHAKHLETTITDVDFDIIKRTYRWKNMKVRNFIRYKRGYLPHDFVRSILDLYKSKTQLKGVEGMELEYMKGKELLNSCYGMTVTAICRPEITFERGEWSLEAGDYSAQIDAYNNSKRRFLSYAWGVWTTAYARRNVWSGILECAGDYLYSDTDSLKIIHAERHDPYIRRYNDVMMGKLKKAMEFHKFPIEDCYPMTKDGVVKPLGVWDYEGTFDSFKTLGAKRYMTLRSGKLSITVSGVNKDNAVPYLLDAYKTVQGAFDAFDDGLSIPAEYERLGEVLSATGKNTHTYIDAPRKGVLVDYLGNAREYEEFSAIHLSPAGYDLSLSSAYVDFLLKHQDSDY